MGWQDAPVVDESEAPAQAQPAWMSAPVVSDDSTPPSPSTPANAQATPAAKEDEKPGFLASVWDEVKKTDISENVFTRMSRYTNDLAAIFDSQRNKYDQMKASGQSMIPFDDWIALPENSPSNIYQATQGHAPELDVDWKSLPKNVADAAINNPGQFIGGLVRGAITDPELFVMPELGLAKKAASLGKVAETVARGAEGAATMGAQGAGINTVEQVQETGTVNPKQAAQAGAQMAVTGLALGAGTHAVTKLVTDTSKGVAARIVADGKEPTAEQTASVNAAYNDAVAQGASPTDAFVETLKQHGIDPTKAEDLGENLADGLREAVQPENERASNQEGKQDQGGNAEGVRSEEGQGGVLREREQGNDQGRGPEDQPPAEKAQGEVDLDKPLEFTPEPPALGEATIKEPPSWEDAEHYDMRPPEMKEAAAAIENAGKPLNERPVTRPPVEPPKVEVPKSDGTVAPRLEPDEWMHTTNQPGLSELDPAMAREGNKYGKAVYVSKDHAESARHKPTRIKNGELQPAEAQSPSETVLVSFTPKNPFVVSGDAARPSTLFDRATAEKYLAKAQMEPDEIAKVLGKKQQVSADTVWKELKKFTGGNEHAQAVVREMGHDAIIYNDGKNAAIFQKVTPRREGAEALARIQEASKSGPPITAPEPPRYTSTKGVPPDRQLKANFGAHGMRDIVFSHPMEKEMFRLAAIGRRTHKNPTTYQLMDALSKRIAAHLDVTPKEAFAAADKYREMVLDTAKLNPENSVVSAPSVHNFNGGPSKQGGYADPKLLAAIGLAGIAASAAYALGGDKSKVVAAAAAAGLLPFARGIVKTLRLGNKHLVDGLDNVHARSRQVFRDNIAQRRVTEYAVNQWQRATTALLKGEPDVKASLIRVRDAVQGHDDVELSPREQAVANEVKKFLDVMGQKGLEGKVLSQLREDYLPGLYQKSPMTSWRQVIDEMTQADLFRGNYTGMSPRSRHNLQKIFPDYRAVEKAIADGTLKGIVPLTGDPVAMAGQYGRSLSKTLANKALIDKLKKFPSDKFKIRAGKDGEEIQTPIPVLVPFTTRDAAARAAQAVRIVGEQAGLSEDAIKAAQKFAVLHAPQDYVSINHPALEGMKVHRDIAGPMRLMFGDGKLGPISQAAYAGSMAAKSALFAFSLFHAGSLLQVGIAQAVRHPLMFPRNLVRAHRMGLDTAFNRQTAEALTDGLTMAHQMDDVDPTFLQRTYNFAEAALGKVPGGSLAALPVKAVKVVSNTINHFLWDYLHPTLKLATYMAEKERWAEQVARGKAKVTDSALAGRQIAQGVNDLFGGLNWFELANNVDNEVGRTLLTALYSPNGRKWMQIMALAPDWNIAALRSWTEGAKAFAPGIDAKASDSLYRSYLATTGLLYLGAAYALQKHYTGENLWDKDDWSYVDMGDGRRIQLNKHFMEGMHLISNPGKFVLNKMGYVPREVLSQIFGKDYLTYEPPNPAKGYRDTYLGRDMADKSLAARAAHAVKGLVTPITAANAIVDPASAISGFFGLPISGRAYPQQAEDAADRAKERAKAEGKDQNRAAERAKANAATRRRRDDAARAANRRKAGQ